MKGTISAIKYNRGFGFILDENRESRFFHANDTEAEFAELQVCTDVIFEPRDHPALPNNGRRALKVRAA